MEKKISPSLMCADFLNLGLIYREAFAAPCRVSCNYSVNAGSETVVDDVIKLIG